MYGDGRDPCTKENADVKLRRFRFPLVGMAALVLVGTALTATPASVTVDTIGGQQVVRGQVSKQVTGNVTVTGRSALAGSDSQAKPLVADAGDSSFTPVGSTSTLLGAGFGGAEPYTFAWTSPVGTLAGADAPTAQLSGAPAGTHTVSLTVTDSGGATATDTVKVVVFQSQQQTLLDQTKADLTPGATGTGAKVEFPFTVPAGTSRFDVRISWATPANDYDLRVLDPSGTQRASHGDAPPTTEENASVSGPQTGTWTVVADKYATAGDNVRAQVTATVAPGGDPRPAVTSGGPYRFATGAAQNLDGTVTGGTAPVNVRWDTDEDGVYESSGADITTQLAEGTHVVSLKATDANGLERRETTTVLVADPAFIAQQTTPITVIGVADSGINPYHLEFSAQTYPDPAVLRLTGNFTKHPSEYIPGYPKDAEALDITLGQGYFPQADTAIWTGNTTIQPQKLYWIPGTKIVGALDAGGSTGATSGEDRYPILDDNGHGSGSASVSAGNRYGYCPTCLLVVVEALDETVVAGYPWVDLSSNSFGYVGGAPLGPHRLAGRHAHRGRAGPDDPVRRRQRHRQRLRRPDRDVRIRPDRARLEHHGRRHPPRQPARRRRRRHPGPHLGVGRRQPALGVPHRHRRPVRVRRHVRRDAVHGRCLRHGAHRGPTRARRRQAGAAARPGRRRGLPGRRQRLPRGRQADPRRAPRGCAEDGTAAEPAQRGLAVPVPVDRAVHGRGQRALRGLRRGDARERQARDRRLLGKAPMPARDFEDGFFAIDRQVRDTIYGGYDRNGDGVRESEALAGVALTPAQVATAEGTMAALKLAGLKNFTLPQQALGGSFERYFLHRRVAAEPGTANNACGATVNESYLDQSDTSADLEPCFENRATSVVAAYRPLGIFASTGTLDKPLAAGSEVIADLYLAGETPSLIRPTGVLMATDREIGEGVGPFQPVVGTGPGGAGCAALGEACWTRYQFSFRTTRPAFRGEQLTFQVQMVGARSWAFGFEGQHASKITILEAPLPADGLAFGSSITEPATGSEVSEGKVVAGGRYDFPNQGDDPTGAGDHPATWRVEVSVGDPSFANPLTAKLHPATRTWSAPLGNLQPGSYTVYTRARMDATTSESSSSTFTVVPDARIEWQVVNQNRAPSAGAWKRATGLESWSFSFDTGAYEKGRNAIIVRLVQKGEETATTWAFARFK